LHCHAEKVVFSYNLQRGKLASFWRNLAFVTATAGKVHAIGKRKTQKKTAQNKEPDKSRKMLAFPRRKSCFFVQFAKGQTSEFLPCSRLRYGNRRQGAYTRQKKKTQKKTAQNKEPTKDRKILAFPRRKSCVFVQLAKGHKLASFWRNLDFVTATAGKVHAIGKRKTQKKTAQTPSFCYRFNASKSVLAVQRFTFKQFSILLQTRFERDLPQKD